MKKSDIFNTPFELGVRMVHLLCALHPRRADLQRLMYLDYAVIYSNDVGGPASLHTPVPLRGAEYISRREVIQQGLYLMAIRSFVDVEASAMGIFYGIGESGPALIELLGDPYSKELELRCRWVSQNLGDKTDVELEQLLGANAVLCRAHFVEYERSGDWT
jgi:hypothetical protein